MRKSLRSCEPSKRCVADAGIASEEELDAPRARRRSADMDGMDKHLAFVLASRGIVTMEDLAEQA